MKLENYPKLTTIMRGYSYEEAMTVIKVLSEFGHQVAVEVTTNNPDYLKIIHNGSEQYGSQVDIGAGTVLTVKQAAAVIDNGAAFLLGPIAFTKEIFLLAKEHDVITVPAAMTPSDVYALIESGADIVKIFPAITVGPTFFKQIQGPLGKLPLMAVGGINQDNASQFLRAGAQYVGVGSAMFDASDIHNRNETGLKQAAQNYLNVLRDSGDQNG